MIVSSVSPRVKVSIHAPAWGATNQMSEVKKVNTVSIHAPAWGATNQMSEVKKVNTVSIHAPAWGATAISSISYNSLMFQSTLPRGERLMEEVIKK